MDRLEQLKAEIIAGLGEKQINEFQEAVDILKKNPQYSQYVEQRKLHLLSSSYGMIDKLLTIGILK